MKEKLRELLDGAWNLPNVLSVIRLCLVPVFVAVHQSGHVYAALAIFVVASLTDALDGYIARSRNLITNFGKLVDPLADKLMMVSAFFCRSTAGVIPIWFVIAVLVKELIMIIGSLMLLKNGIVVHSRLSGKAAMVTFVVTLLMSFFVDAGWYRQITKAIGIAPHIALMYLAAALMLVALFDYAHVTWQQVRHNKENFHSIGE